MVWLYKIKIVENYIEDLRIKLFPVLNQDGERQFVVNYVTHSSIPFSKTFKQPSNEVGGKVMKSNILNIKG